MTATTMPRQQRSTIPLALIIALLLAGIALVWMMADASESHAVTKHGTTASEIRCKAENGQALQTWHNPETDRYAEVCQLESGVYGVRISKMVDGVLKEVTAFAKSKMSTIEQVAKYLTNRGYIQQ